MKRNYIGSNLIVGLIVILTVTSSTNITAATWSTPGRSAGWNATTNWTPAVIPQNVDVIIDGETIFNSVVSLTTNATVNNVTVSEGDELHIDITPYILTIDGISSPVVVDSQGSFYLDGTTGGKGLNIEGSVTWTNKGLQVTGNQNYTQFRIQPGANLTVCEGTSFNFYNQTWCNGIVTNYGTFAIGGMFLGSGGKQVNAGTMEFRSRLSMDVINYIGSTMGNLTVRNVNQEGGCSVEGGNIHFSGGDYDIYRSGYGQSFYLKGTNTTDQDAGRLLKFTRNSKFYLSSAGSYDFNGTIEMDVVRSGTHNNAIPNDAKLIAQNGLVELDGEGRVTMNAGVLTNSLLTVYLQYSVLSGDTATDGIINCLTNGISGAGKIGNDESSFVNKALVDATDDIYTLDFNPAATGSISNAPSGTICATGSAGLLFQDGSFINAGELAILPDSQAIFTNSLSFNNDEGTLAFTIGATTNQTPVIKSYGDVILSGILSVDVAENYDGDDAQLYDIIVCTDGTITDNGITITNLNEEIQFYIADNGSSDGTFTIKRRSGGTIILIR